MEKVFESPEVQDAYDRIILALREIVKRLVVVEDRLNTRKDT